MNPYSSTLMEKVVRKHTLRNLPLLWKVTRYIIMLPVMAFTGGYSLFNLYCIYMLTQSIPGITT